VVLQEAQEPVPPPVPRVGSFGVSSMGTWSDLWPQGRPLVRLQAAQQVISVKNREKSDSGIMKEIVASLRRGVKHININTGGIEK
jgi:hypothetical protein